MLKLDGNFLLLLKLNVSWQRILFQLPLCSILIQMGAAERIDLFLSIFNVKTNICVLF